MSEFTHLIGAEKVQQAGHNMQSAAEQIQRAASQFDDSVLRLIRAMEAHEIRMAEILKGCAS